MTYRLTEGATLVLRVDDGPWQTLTFDAATLPDGAVDNGEINATGEQLAAAIDTLDGVTGSVQDGDLVLSTEDTGETTVLDKWPSKSKDDRGIVHVETKCYKQDGTLVCVFRRKVMVPTAAYIKERWGTPLPCGATFDAR